MAKIRKFWPLLPRINFWRGDWTLASVFIQFWDFLFICKFPKIVSLRSFYKLWGNSCIKFIILSSSNDLNLAGNIINWKNVISIIVELPLKKANTINQNENCLLLSVSEEKIKLKANKSAKQEQWVFRMRISTRIE